MESDPESDDVNSAIVRNTRSNLNLTLQNPPQVLPVSVEKIIRREAPIQSSPHSHNMANDDAKADLTAEISYLNDQGNQILSQLAGHKPLDTPPTVVTEHEIVGIMSDLTDHFSTLKTIGTRTYRLYTAAEVTEVAGPIFTALTDLMKKARTNAQSIKHEYDQKANMCLATKKKKLPLPTFGGEYENWISFKDRFDAAVDRDPTITPAQKLEHLQSCMISDSDPYKLIGSYQITDTNYRLAYDDLLLRYERKRDIFFAYFQNLMDLPALNNQGGLQHMIDTVNQALTKILAMKVSTSDWDPIIAFVVIKRLDYASRREVEKHFKPSVLPKHKELLEFLSPLARAYKATKDTENDKKAMAHPSTTSSTTKPPNPSQFNKSTSSQGRTQPNRTLKCDICTMPHFTFSCKKLTNLPTDLRQKLIMDLVLCENCLRQHQGSPCMSPKRCQTCGGFHHTLLCPSTPSSSHSMLRIPNTRGNSTVPTYDLLATLLVDFIDIHGVPHRFRGLADMGGQFNVISERCASILQLPRRKSSQSTTAAGAVKGGQIRGELILTAQSPLNPEYTITMNSVIMTRATIDHPQIPLNGNTWSHLDSIPLADPSFRQAGRIDFIFGSGTYGRIKKSGFLRRSEDEPVAEETQFGWVVYGETGGSRPNGTPPSSYLCSASPPDPLFDLTRFWQQEELPTLGHKHPKPEHQAAEDHFISSHCRHPTGRYVVQLPFQEAAKALGNSKRQAISRFLVKERGLLKNPTHYSSYQNEFHKLIEPGILVKVPLSQLAKPESQCFYLPHHAIVKEASSTTKTRIVLDGSATSSSGVSLNDTLLVGPTIQEELTSILMRFRTYPVVFTADITKMYNQVAVHPKDHDFLRVIWRKYPTFPLEEYHFTRLPFGLSCAAFLATRSLQQLAKDEEKDFRLGSEVLLKDFYVDDCLSGGLDLKSALNKKDELTRLLSKGEFSLTKWVSNDQTFLDSISPHDRATDEQVEIGRDVHVKALGIRWNPKQDTFFFTANHPKLQQYTKREVTSIIARLFDPLGWLQPVIVVAKLIVQDIWRANIDWNAQVPESIQLQWKAYLDDLQQIQRIQIPRKLFKNDPINFQIHGFSDASTRAYGAALYLRSTYQDQSVTSRLIMSKSRVTPKKMIAQSPDLNQSIPRLELMGALMCAQLMEIVKCSLNLKISETHLWTDSSITLWRIHNPKLKKDPFVAARIARILSQSSPNDWHYVKTSENPADCLSRGISTSQLASHSTWWHGPSWLSDSTFPVTPIPGTFQDLGLKEENPLPITVHLTSSIQLDLNSGSRTLTGLLRATAFIHRGIRAVKERLNGSPPGPHEGPLKPIELTFAQEAWISKVQLYSFPVELSRLQKQKPIKASSKILKLAPTLDNHGLLRVGGRLQKSKLPEDFKHQYILPGKHEFTTLLIRNFHHRLLHAGAQQVRYALHEQFWIIHGREAVRKLISHCLICFRFIAKPSQQLMGNLPQARVVSDRVFKTTGVDFGGPLPIKLSAFRTTRNRPESNGKAYIALFICMWSKLIHLELVTGLTTELFLAAFTRFMGIWPKPDHMYSDNGTNFVGADNEMKEFQDFISSSQNHNAITNSLTSDGIAWHLNPPSAPHQGGLWEAGIKSTKYHLKRIVGERLLSYEELSTVLCQIQAVLNSRPLYPLEASQTEHYPLTPAHFYLFQPLTALPRPDLSHLPLNRLNKYEELQQAAQHFRERWSKEYLIGLQERCKWNSEKPNPKVGQMVLIVDNLKPSLKWDTGRITHVHPGEDGLVRKVTLETDTGTYIRPIVKIIPYPDRTIT